MICCLEAAASIFQMHAHFINPCCFGEDLAAWLRGELLERGVDALEPYQEDWGWELQARLETDSYYLCVGGNSDDGMTDQGEWRIIVEKRRSIWERLTGRGKIAEDDRMLKAIEDILASHPDFKDVHREASET